MLDGEHGARGFWLTGCGPPERGRERAGGFDVLGGGPAEPPARPPAPGKGQDRPFPPCTGGNPATSPGRHWSPLTFPTGLFQTPGSHPGPEPPHPAPSWGPAPRVAVSGSLGREAGARSGGGRPGTWARGWPFCLRASCLRGPGPGPLVVGPPFLDPDQGRKGKETEPPGTWRPPRLAPGLEVVSLCSNLPAPSLNTTLDLPMRAQLPGLPHSPVWGLQPWWNSAPCDLLMHTPTCSTHTRIHAHQPRPGAPVLAALPGATLGRGGSAGGHAPFCRSLLGTYSRGAPGPP